MVAIFITQETDGLVQSVVVRLWLKYSLASMILSLNGQRPGSPM
jgi:hypothetical protein